MSRSYIEVRDKKGFTRRFWFPSDRPFRVAGGVEPPKGRTLAFNAWLASRPLMVNAEAYKTHLRSRGFTILNEGRTED